MGSQLVMGQTIPEWFDKDRNHYYLDDNKLFYKHKENQPILLGYVQDDTLVVIRDRSKHVLHIYNSYGFNYEMIGLIGFTKIVIYENQKIFHIPIRLLLQHGKTYHANDPFDSQILLNLDIIDSLEINPTTHEDYEKRVSMFGLEWFHVVKEELLKPYMIKLGRFLASRRKSINIYPEAKDMFNAFKSTPYSEIKLVIVGGEPYNSSNISDGLAFSSNDNLQVPKPLEKIYDSLEKELGFGNFLEMNPSLNYWAEQGVFLLNRVLTVEHQKANSHTTIGWKSFTEKILKHLSENKENLVFLLIGSTAKSLRPLIDNPKHMILESEHPGFAAKEDRDWKNDKMFSKANSYLKGLNKSEIQW